MSLTRIINIREDFIRYLRKKNIKPTEFIKQAVNATKINNINPNKPNVKKEKFRTSIKIEVEDYELIKLTNNTLNQYFEKMFKLMIKNEWMLINPNKNFNKYYNEIIDDKKKEFENTQ